MPAPLSGIASRELRKAILSGWFQEWGSLSLVIATGVVLLYDVAIGYRYSLVYAGTAADETPAAPPCQVEHLRQMSQKGGESAKNCAMTLDITCAL